MPTLFDRLDVPDYEGMTAEEAWKACQDWQDWAYQHNQSISEAEWDEWIRIMSANYDRYYERYENDDDA